MATSSLSSSAVSGGVSNASSGHVLASSSMAGRYANVITSMSDLQGDLAASLATLRSLRQEKDALADANAALRADYGRMKATAEEARRIALSEAEARVAAERAQESLVHEWRGAVAAKEKELGVLAERMQPPRDLQALRVQIMEEVAASYAATKAALEGEVEKHRSAASSAVRDLESVKASHASIIATLTKDAEAAAAGHAAALAEAQRAVSALQKQLDGSARTHANEIAEVRAAAEEAAGRLSSLTLELEEVRAERDTLREKSQREESARTREAAATAVTMRMLETAKSSSERRFASSSSEVSTLRGRLEEVSGRLATATVEMETLRAEAVVKQRAFENETQSLSSRLSSNRSEWERDRSSLVAAHERTVEETVRELQDAHKRRERDLTSALDSAQRKVELAEERATELARELNTLRSRVVGAASSSSRPGSRVGAGGGVGSRRGSAAGVAAVGHGEDGMGTGTGSSPSSPLKASSLGMPPAGGRAGAAYASSSTAADRLRLISSQTLGDHADGDAWDSGVGRTGNGGGVGRSQMPSSHAQAADDDEGSAEGEEMAAAAARSDVAQMQGETQALRRSVADLRGTIASQQAQLAHTVVAVASAGRQRADADGRAREAEAKARLFAGHLEATEAALREAESSLTRLRDRHANELASSAGALQAMREGLESALAEEAHARMRAEEEAGAAVAEAEALSRKAAAYKSKLLRLYALYTDLKAQLADATAAGQVAAAGRKVGRAKGVSRSGGRWEERGEEQEEEGQHANRPDSWMAALPAAV